MPDLVDSEHSEAANLHTPSIDDVVDTDDAGEVSA
jgi:hypothetical protein